MESRMYLERFNRFKTAPALQQSVLNLLKTQKRRLGKNVLWNVIPALFLKRKHLVGFAHKTLELFFERKNRIKPIIASLPLKKALDHTRLFQLQKSLLNGSE